MNNWGDMACCRESQLAAQLRDGTKLHGVSVEANPNAERICFSLLTSRLENRKDFMITNFYAIT
jgi:hypothetical protein